MTARMLITVGQGEVGEVDGCAALRTVMERARPTGGAPSANVCRKGHKISCECGHETFMMRRRRLPGQPGQLRRGAHFH